MKQKAKNTQYFVELMSALLLYGIVLAITMRFAPQIRSSSLKIVVMLSPILPIGLAI